MGKILLKYGPLFTCALLLLLCSARLPAQDLGSIVGTVSDPSGAGVPGAEITVTNQATGVVVRATKTTSVGDYTVSDLPASTYTVRARVTGFETAVQTGIVVSPRSIIRGDFQLKMGAVTEEVTVTAPPVHLETETGVVSSTISGQEVAQIDTNGRSFIQLATLLPGASSELPSFNTPVGVTASASISFNGEEPDHNVWYVDGMENYDRGCGGCITVLPDQDSIQEFKVETSNMTEDSGFGSGGHIQMEIKSGTDQFHGEGFEFNRNTVLDASSFFANATATPKGTLNFNDFGFNLGGPIYLPGHEKKTFFFFEGDWRYLVQGSTIVAPAIPTAWTGGDFSSYGQPILDHTKPVTLPNGTTGYTPFASNTIPTGMLNPNSLILGKSNFILPAPNTASGFFAESPSVPTKVNEQILRVDHQFSEKTSLMFHYIREGVNQTFPTTLWSSDTYPSIGTDFINPPQMVQLKLTRTINPTLLNEFMFGYQRQPLVLNPTGTYKIPSGTTIQLPYNNNADDRIPTIGLDGPAVGANYDPYSWPWFNVSNTETYRDILTKTRGSHTINVGFEYMRFLKEQPPFGDTQGDYTFNGGATAGSYLGPNGQVLSTPGNEFADFMLGQAFSFTQLEALPAPAFITNNYSLWVGDSWKVKRGLTLTLGVRWEGLPHAYEKNNRMSSFRTSVYNPADAPQVSADGSLVPGTGNVLDGIVIAGQNGVPRGLVDNHLALFLPRIGLAWQPTDNGKTVFRGGYGMFYDRPPGGETYPYAGNPPFLHSITIFDTGLTNPAGVAGVAFPSNVQAVDPNYRMPYSQQWSLGVERQVTPKILLSLMYVGSKGTDDQINVNINQPFQPAGSANVDTVRPYLGWGNIDWFTNSVSSSYNSLQASMRFSNWHGLTSGIAYTWSHCLDISDGDFGSANLDAYNVRGDYGNCSYDRRQMLIANYVYALPLAKNATGVERAALGGWQLSGISTFYSGLPFSASYPGDPAGIGGGPYRGQMAGNPNSGAGIHTASEWFNVNAFTTIPAGTFGDSARNNIYGAGINNWDISLFKDFKGIPLPGRKEGADLQFRGEFFNAFNHAQFNGYFTTFGAPGFGAPNATRDPREVQLGLKLMF
jgi:hypothetical protein